MSCKFLILLHTFILIIIVWVSNTYGEERTKRWSFNSIVPSFLNPCNIKEEKPIFSFDSIIPDFNGLTQKEDRCKDPLKYAAAGAVKAVVSRLMGPLLIPEVLKTAQINMAGVIVEQSIEVGLKEKNIAKAIATPIGAQIKMIPIYGEKFDNFAEPLLEKTIVGFLGTLCEQINCCFD